VLQLHKTQDGAQEYAEFLHLPKRRFTDFCEHPLSSSVICSYWGGYSGPLDCYYNRMHVCPFFTGISCAVSRNSEMIVHFFLPAEAVPVRTD